MITQTVVEKVTSKLPRVMVYLDSKLKQDSEKLATKEKRSLSNLINVLLQKAVDEAKARGELESDSP